MITLQHYFAGVMAQWLELWSPWLKATGVVLVLVGGGLLAYEWRYRTEESIKSALQSHRSTKKTESDYALMVFSALRHRRIYQIGYVLVVIGVILQFGATEIGWVVATFFS